MGHCMEVLDNLNSAIDVFEYYPTRDRLVIVTKTLLMTQLQVFPDGRLNSLMRVKLSMKGDSGIEHVAWVGDGLLATACPDENIVRVWDLAFDENYTMSLQSGDRSISRSDRVAALAYSPTKSTLAVGTRDGKVVMWRHFASTAVGRTESSAEHWTPLPSIEIGKPVQELRFGPNGRLLTAALYDDVAILCETILQRKVSGDISVVQLSNDELSVERQGGSSSSAAMSVQCGIAVKGLDVHGRHLVVWNGSKAEVYEVGSHSVKLTTTFATKATAIALHNDNVFACVEEAVVVCNLGGTVKQTLSYSEADGRPTHVDAGPGKFVAVATAKGKLRILDVSRSQPRYVGSPGNFEGPDGKSLGVIQSIRCNAEGNRISVLATKYPEGEGEGTDVNADHHVFVYDADNDAVSEYNLGLGRQGRFHCWDTEESKLLAVEVHRVSAPQKSADGTGDDAEGGSKAKDTSDKSESKGGDSAASKGAAGGAGGSKSGGGGGGGVGGAANSDGKGTDGSDEPEGGAGGSGGPKRTGGRGRDDDAGDAEVEVLTLFATARDGVILQDAFPLEGNLDALMALRVPRLYFVTKATATSRSDRRDRDRAEGKSSERSDEAGQRRIQSRPLRDFVGLDSVDAATRRALLDFSYHLATGNMDEAYKAVKLIENPTVWENMAHMCVKSKRLDVAEVCLGNMGHARGARAVREAKAEPEVDAAVAMVAIQLGLLGDAARLYRGCGRHDLLNKLYQASGQWGKALSIASKHDRIHLRTTHYLFAKHLEALGDMKNAMKHYEKADAHRYEVPRMLFDAQDLDGLERYISGSNDRDLQRWWAQYCESKGEFKKAVKYYQRAKDTLALVRVFCYNQEFATAAELVLENNDKSAAYHLARQHEARGNVREALAFFERAGRFNHAVRLAKEAGFDSELMNLSLQSSKQTMLETARHFESTGQPQKAVQLYQKAGALPKALDLCFRAELFDDLRTISEELGDDTPPEVLGRVADFFIEHRQYDKAVALQVTAKRYNHALDLAMTHKVTISEDLAEKLTLPRATTPQGKTERSELLRKLAKCLKRQGSYHLAAKKYTQAGDKLKAMKALLKSGDTEKIIFFAGVSRSPQIYILAANYLQNLDWHNEAEVMTAIINFYNKAKAYDQLAGFYDACAQVEIDEYRNYEKALAALEEAVKYTTKSRGAGGDKERRLHHLNQRIELVQRFVSARQMVKSNPEGMVKACNALLDTRDIESSIRIGDVFALLIEYHYAKRDMNAAYRLIEDMRERNIVMHPYLDQEMVNAIYRAVGIEPAAVGGARGAGDDDEVEDEIVEEDVPDEPLSDDDVM